jgi:hypothetical protein
MEPGRIAGEHRPPGFGDLAEPAMVIRQQTRGGAIVVEALASSDLLSDSVAELMELLEGHAEDQHFRMVESSLESDGQGPGRDLIISRHLGDMPSMLVDILSNPLIHRILLCFV